jgi:hypothetical protein
MQTAGALMVTQKYEEHGNKNWMEQMAMTLSVLVPLVSVMAPLEMTVFRVSPVALDCQE